MQYTYMFIELIYSTLKLMITTKNKLIKPISIEMVISIIGDATLFKIVCMPN